jgi:spermidine/putrescine transport system ATP-binding protein
MSSRIAVMNAGRVEQLDTPEEIYKRPATPFVAGFIGQANLLPGRILRGSAGEVELELDGGGRGRAAAPPGLAAGRRVLLMLRPEQVNLTAGTAARADGFPARLSSVDFQGSAFRYALRREDGREVVVTLLPQHQLTGAAVGDQVWVGWDPALSWVVSDEA